ncbi:toxin TcdB middle/N-terminal domain-containing protein [Leisingera sp. ANG-M7]|uniref:toxin TcdB middle/N-terminal domain-containing protein n=1 Tax=Leisingera sp. ANG-M7 TaxID=1577902 RepID=UPI0019D3D90C|nr:toxin TcdB middle/N-terminal domain-containing protein [Leisingera sp. ANG-M7]
MNGQQVEYFEVTNDKGVVYTYRALGAINGDTSSGDEFDALFRRKFLLTEIRDTQQTANTVTYNYFFASKANARAHRPASVTYANGYQVVFRYEVQSEPVASYAVGTAGQFGRQYYRLKSVFVKDGSQKIRAYKLQYQRSAVTRAHQLSRVRLYGSDYTVDGNDNITGGTQQPSPLKDLAYASDAAALQKKTYSNTTFLRNVRVFDADGDNRDEFVVPTRHELMPEKPAVECMISDYQRYASYPARQYTISNQQTGALTQQAPHSVWDDLDILEPNETGSRFDIHTVLPATAVSDQAVLAAEKTTHVRDGDIVRPSPPFPELQFFGLNGANSNFRELSAYTYFTKNVGNFDADAELEVLMFPRTGGQMHLVDLHPVTQDSIIGQGAPSAHNPSGQKIDLDGDGMSELVFLPSRGRYGWEGVQTGFSGPYLNGGTSQETWLSVDFRGRVPHMTNLPPIGPAIADPHNPLNPVFSGPHVPVDVNGDGKQDLAFVSASLVNPGKRAIFVAVSTGQGFLSPEEWVDSSQTAGLREIAQSSGSYSQSYVSSTGDVNGDGLDDLVISNPYIPQDLKCGKGIPTIKYTPIFSNSPGRVFLSTGTGFIAPEDSGIPEIPGYVETGDFDGNGLPDFISEDPDNGSIWFGDGDVAHLLTGLTNGQGGETVVAYAPSTAIGNNNNDVPFVQQLVDSITVKDGRGQSRKTRFTYVNNAYDYENRRPLGYRTVTAYLPTIPGESEGLQVVTTYLNGHIGERGRIKSQLRKQDGTTYSQVINDWSDVNAEAKGPYRVTRSSTRTRTRSGSKLIETMKAFTWTVYGAPKSVIDYGFTSGGTDLDLSDDVTTMYWYEVNLAKYLVSFPVQKKVMAGRDNTGDKSKWLSVHQYKYEGAASVWETTPSVNLVNVRDWDGDTASSTSRYRINNQYEYDGRGNVTKETDAGGNASVFAYDTKRYLFRVRETNAKGHVTATAWNQKCQQPSKVTDPNGLATTYTYDKQCREDYAALPGGNYVDTRRRNLGDPTAQYIETVSPSPSTASGSSTQISREYFDGLGQVYKTAVTGTTSAQADMITTVKGFDPRGNLRWESIPLSFADGSDVSAIPAGSKTVYKYDPLDRVITKFHPGGAKATTSYDHQTIGGLSHPRMILRSEECPPSGFAPNCIEVRHTYDARGNRVRMAMTDHESTDVGASGIHRATIYSYDLLNRLTGVTDPGGAAWAYTYDVRGNRLTSDDPGLGYWTMRYDANNNLTRQVDAKGQVITFTYDELNRVTEKKVTWTEGGSQVSDVVTSIYDEVPANGWKTGTGFNTGQLVTQANGDHQIDYRYDRQGNPYWERHKLLNNDDVYIVYRKFHESGALIHSVLPKGTGTDREATPDFNYDAAGRVTGFGSYITNVTYNLRNQPTWTDFSSGVREEVQYNNQRGWINKVRVHSPSSSSSQYRGRRTYTRSESGRVVEQWAGRETQRFNYCYDYAGRLLVAADLNKEDLTCATIGSWNGEGTHAQFFTYRLDGSMVSNSAIGGYSYGGPVRHAPASVAGQTFAYDANGNMLTGLDGKVMTYDGENRPLTVSKAGNSTTYVYAADGTRLKRVEQVDGEITTSLYVGGVEIVNPGATGQEVHWYPHPNVRMDYADSALEEVKFLHRDQLDSVFVITDENGGRDAQRDFAPFGDETETVQEPEMAGYPEKEDFGFIGEREDEAAGLMYLNARYYDPELASFIPADALAEGDGNPANFNAAPAEAPAQAAAQ